MADAFELLAERHDRDEVRRLEHPDFQRLAAQRIPERRHRGKGTRDQTTGQKKTEIHHRDTENTEFLNRIFKLI